MPAPEAYEADIHVCDQVVKGIRVRRDRALYLGTQFFAVLNGMGAESCSHDCRIDAQTAPRAKHDSQSPQRGPVSTKNVIQRHTNETIAV